MSKEDLLGPPRRKEVRSNPSGQVFMRQQRSDSVLAPRSAVHKHCNPWRILGVSSNYFKKDEIFTLEVPVRKHRKPKMRETAKEIDINWCEEYKFKKVIVLNYTERGKKNQLPQPKQPILLL